MSANVILKPRMSRHSAVHEKIEITEEHDVLSPEELKLKSQEAQLDIVKKLRSSGEWIETVPYVYMTASALEHSYSANTLRGPNKILRKPLKFFNQDTTKCIIIIHLGDHLCDGSSWIHNGVLATLLDEHLAFVSLPSLPNFTGFTANLNIDYLQPVLPNSWIVLHGVLNKVEGRKAFAEAWIENTEGGRMAEAKSLYISPRT